MKKPNRKNFVLLFVSFFILFNQIQAQTETVSKIDEYGKTVSRLMKKTRQRIFADVASDNEKVDWKEFKTEKLRDAADKGDNLNQSAYVWTKAGKVVAAAFTLQSPSRDWVQYITYFYHTDGTLAKTESQLNTFYGDVTVKRNYYFDSKGETIKQDVNYFDLQSQKSIDIKEREKMGEFIDRKVKFFKDTSDLPFSKLLDKK